MSQDKKILVTGGCGQLGVFVVNRLVEEGYELVVLDKSLPNSDTHVIFQKGKVKFYPCDLLHEDEVRNLSRELNQIQCAIHLASMVDGSVDVLGSAVASIKLNVLATINLLSLVPHLRHFVYASSMMVYGYPQLTPLPERHPTEPTNIYGVAKLAAEKYLHVYALQQKVKTTVLRLSSLYGPGQYSEGNRNRVIPLFSRKIRNGEPLTIFPGDEEEIRDYLHLNDAARAFVLAVQKSEGGVFNIGSGRGISIRDLVETMVHLSKREVRCQMGDRRPSKPANYTLDITKAKNVLGFESRIPIQHGLKEEIQASA